MENRQLKTISEYMAKIGSKGGKRSRRKLDPLVAQNMVLVREARRAYKKFHTQCFWSYDPNYIIKQEDVSWVGEQLKKHGDRKLWKLGMKLCR